MQTLIQYAELASLILTVAGGLMAIAARVWLFLEHGKPDVRADWLRKAVQLAVAARQDADHILGTGPGTAIETQTLKDIGGAAEKWLLAHNIRASLDPRTIELVLADLRSIANAPAK